LAADDHWVPPPLSVRLRTRGNSRIHRSWHQISTSVARCVRDPAADAALAQQHRSRQFHALVLQLPISAFGSSFTAAILTARFWHHGHHALLTAWFVAIAVLAASDLLMSWRRRAVGREMPVSDFCLRMVVARLGLGALLIALMAARMFALADPNDRPIVGAVTAAVLATGGWRFAYVPQAAIAWIVALSSGAGIGVIALVGATQIPLALLLAGFGIMLIFMVMMTSRLVLAGLISEAEVERQKSLLGLLLDDFEDGARDWLWEVDRAGNFRRSSVRMANAVGQVADDVLGKSVIEMLFTPLGEPSAADAALLRHLAVCLKRREPFRDVVVPGRPDGEKVWLSITAKPLFLPTGEFDGWRGVGSDITAVRQRELDMVRLANIDPLTGLSNRHQFNEQLKKRFEATSGAATACTLFLIDLDNFKAVNDSLGHDAGDRLLQGIARRLTDRLPPQHLLARLGGDEFAVVVLTRLDRHAAEELGCLIQAAIADEVVLEGQRMHMPSSVGVAFAPADANTADDLLKASDMALYAAKAAGRRTIRFFDPTMDIAARHRLSVVNDLDDGLQRGEFDLHYQPQVDLATGELVGFEALVRWNHPTRGLIAPADFVPIAEDSGLIVPLGTWVIAKACADAIAWPEAFSVAVNVSAKQLSDGNLVHIVEAALRRSGLPGSRLEIEITESSLITDNGETLALLHSLRELGVRISLDDFGTGYSSLSYLRRFPLDRLKIDRSFVNALAGDQQSAENTAVVTAIIQLANVLGFDTIAEGIETEAQHRVLREIGCVYGQGYLIAKPLDPAAMAAYLSHEHQRVNQPPNRQTMSVLVA
jgi:diguanylate cyclase (GGDEF)-like protein/PAS domain S-box-containing protein